MDAEQTGLSGERILGIARRRAIWVVLCVVLAAGAAYGVSKRQTKKYTATASLAFSYSSLSQQIAGLGVPSGANLAAQQASNLDLVKLGDMARQTAKTLGHGLTIEKVAHSVTVSGQGESSIVGVSATATSPTLAAAIANTYVTLFVKEQQRANRSYFKSALAVVHRQLAALPPAQRIGGAGVALQDRAQTLGLLAELNYGNVQVAQEAAPPTSPSSPKTKRNTVLGAILGLVLGIGVAFLLEQFDPRVREPEELESIYELPMLGAIPKSPALQRSQQGMALPAGVAEAFNMIRAHLRFFSIDREMRMLIVASPAEGDGKTTIARRLAEVSAQSGARVLLVELDLRRPRLAQELGIHGAGLADILIGEVSIAEATQSIEVSGAARDHAFDVLVAGTLLPPNPGELLESRMMDSLLAQARSTYDVVIIDTPPLAAVSDALTLLRKVDGVVVVGRIGQSRRDAAEALHKVLVGSGAPLLGIVANGVKAGHLMPYGGKSAGSTPAGKPRPASEELVSSSQA